MKVYHSQQNVSRIRVTALTRPFCNGKPNVLCVIVISCQNAEGFVTTIAFLIAEKAEDGALTITKYKYPKLTMEISLGATNPEKRLT
jgi:hypothetical protein